MAADRSSEAPDDVLGPDANGIASLADPMRRALYRYVVDAGGDVGRDDAAESLGVSRSLAAYHLDRLVADGLLDVRFARRSGRRGPGAGRPAKLYTRSRRAVQVSLPPRDYEVAARVLARAAETDPSSRRALFDEAYRFGRDVGEEGAGGDGEAVVAVLRARGYEPFDDEGVVRLRNCPFDALAHDHRDLVCGMNLALLSGLVTALGLPEHTVRLDPREGCC
ncbi:MAG TPA: transcriptional regulator, partial [Acidimicrobiia bacterium]|nr:transcriptional regulator [Acidimicrobiia bacterium]